MFHYSWIEGNSDALQKEKTVVLTASLAKKYFGNESALNKVFNFNNEFDVTVTGVIADPPLNTDFPFRMILSSRLGKDKRGWDDWGAMSSSINCMVKLNETTSKEAFEAKLKDWHLKYFTGKNEEDGKVQKIFLTAFIGNTYRYPFSKFWWPGSIEGYFIIAITDWAFIIADSLYQFHKP